MTQIRRRTYLVIVLVLLTSIATFLAHPSVRLADQLAKFELDTMIPRHFGDWVMDERQAAVVLNPQSNDLQSRLYQQVLARTYINRKNGQAIMLSIAYGENQSHSNDLHVPDVCYPAGGYKVESAQRSQLDTSYGAIPIKRLVTQRLSRREPLTYWAIVGEHVATGAVESKLIGLSYGLRGTVPDGLIFRVSSVGLPDDVAFAAQQAFVQTLLDSLSATDRKRLSGI